MSHLKERKDPTCLNCQTNPLYGRYCHVCGQENLEPKETVWHLVLHFFNDITHFDGKFFSTVKFLFSRPGFLSAEYAKGRRASYLNPIRMYVFTSAIFFIILFSLPSSRNVVKVNEGPQLEKSKGLKELYREKQFQENGLRTTDTGYRRLVSQELDRINTTINAIRKLYGDTTTRTFTRVERRALLFHAFTDSLAMTGISPGTEARLREEVRLAADTSNHIDFFGLNDRRYPDVASYDSIQHAMPDSLRDGWFKHILVRRMVNANQQIRQDQRSYNEHLIENFLHSFPKILFFSLPFFALILRLLYVRRKILYVEHGIFTIHVYCATFLSTLALILVQQLTNAIDAKWFNVTGGILIVALVIYMFFYLYKAMRVFYKQRRAKTILKYCLLCLMALAVNTILLVLFFMISAISV